MFCASPARVRPPPSSRLPSSSPLRDSCVLFFPYHPLLLPFLTSPLVIGVHCCSPGGGAYSQIQWPMTSGAALYVKCPNLSLVLRTRNGVRKREAALVLCKSSELLCIKRSAPIIWLHQSRGNEPALAPPSVYLLFSSARILLLKPSSCISKRQSSFNASPKDLAQHLAERKGMRKQGGCRRIMHAWAPLCCETFCESAVKPFKKKQKKRKLWREPEAPESSDRAFGITHSLQTRHVHNFRPN